MDKLNEALWRVLVIRAAKEILDEIAVLRNCP